MPSLYEGFGIAALEALAAGVPVIASEVGGIPEIIENGKNGLLVSPNDSCELCGKILDLAADKNIRIKFSDAGKKLSYDFSGEKMTDRYFGIYEKLLSPNIL